MIFSEDLDTVVFTVADKDVAVGHHRHTFKAFEFSLSRSPATEGPQEGAIRVEDLNAVVTAVSHEDVTLVVHSHTPWELELSLVASLGPKCCSNFAINVKYLYAVVVRIRDDDSVGGGNCDVMRVFQLSWLVAHRPELAYKGSVGLEDLNSVVLLVTDVDETKGISGHSPWIREPPISSTLTSKGPEKHARRIKYLNPMVVAVGNDVLADSVDSHARQTIKFAFCTPVRTEFFYKLTLLVKYLHAVVARVCNHNTVVGSNSYASWPCKVSSFTTPTPDLN